MPTAPTPKGLERLAAEDQVVAPLAALQAVALSIADEPGWDAGLPALGANSLADGTPLLHGLTVTVERDRQQALLARLAATLAGRGSADGSRLSDQVRAGDLDALALLSAGLTHDTETIERLASAARVGADLLALLGHVATLPLLLACGRRAEPLIRSAAWPGSCCPVCAAWPILAEVRGLARDLVLRCGRCASAWRGQQGRCAFCGSQDHQTQGYLAAEQERESRRAAVCDACGGYLKTVSTLGALSPADLLVGDLQSLELDVAAMDQGYARPDGLGSELAMRVQAAPDDEPVREAGAPRGWRRWLA
jgi:FdhE protein